MEGWAFESLSIDTIDHVPLAAICYSVLHLQLILLRWRNWASINCKDTSLCSRRQSPRFNCTRNSNPLSETNESDRKRLHLQLSLQRTIEQVQMHLQTMQTNESDQIAPTPAPLANDPDKKVPAWGIRALCGYFDSSDPTFDRYVPWWGSKSKHHKDMCSKVDRTTSSNISNYSTLNGEHNWENLCI